MSFNSMVECDPGQCEERGENERDVNEGKVKNREWVGEGMVVS